MSHNHAHGPANRGRIVRTTAAPVFVCEPTATPRGAVIVLHGVGGITAGLEAGMRTAAARGLLAVAPFLYYRDGGPEYPQAEQAREAWARLTQEDLDTDIDAAAQHVTTRLGVTDLALAGADVTVPAMARATGRRPYATTVVVDSGGADTGEGAPDWSQVVDRLTRAFPAEEQEQGQGTC
jgi:hypothetical protein